MTKFLPTLSGVSYTVGRARPLTELARTEQAPPAVVAALQARGLSHFCDEQRPVSEILWETASASLTAAAIDVAEIDGIVFVNSPIEEKQLIRSLNEAGFNHAWLLGLNYQDCGGSEAALRVASDLVTGAGRTRRVLVFLYGRVSPGESRIGWEGETVFSDGALAYVVSAPAASPDKAGYAIVASEVMTNPRLARYREQGAQQARYLEECLSTLKSVSASALGAAQIGMAEVERIYATNGNRSYHNIIASALGVRAAKVETQALAKYGHVFSCDGLIGLADGAGCQSGQHVMLLSWSPWVMGVSILRKL